MRDYNFYKLELQWPLIVTMRPELRLLNLHFFNICRHHPTLKFKPHATDDERYVSGIDGVPLSLSLSGCFTPCRHPRPSSGREHTTVADPGGGGGVQGVRTPPFCATM